MKTMINGKEAEWPGLLWEVWNSQEVEGPVELANYFTPRPYRNIWDKGSTTKGFTYTVNRRVYIINLVQS